MSGRRGARGRGGRTNLEAIGIQPGESVPPPILQPPPLYPPMERRPLELSPTETDRYLVRVKQELQQLMQQSPFFLKSDSTRTDIKRYSDKYKTSLRQNDLQQLLTCIPSWSLFPRELRLSCRRRPKSTSRYNPVLSSARAQSSSSTLSEGLAQEQGGGVLVASSVEKTLSKLEELEKTGTNTEEGNEEEVVDDEVYDEEVEEEEGDYQLSYFDAGEDFVVDEDDVLEDSHF